MKFLVTMVCALALSPLSFAEDSQETAKDIVEVVVTAEKITEAPEKPQVEGEEVQGVVLAELSDRLSESVKPI